MKRILTLLSILSIGLCLFGQERTISGIVTDDDGGIPLPGASIIIEGTTNGSITDFDGNFSLKADKGQTLVFSYMGYVAQKVLVADQATINVVLKLDQQTMEEVVVIGYSTQKKSLVTGSIAKVDAESLTKNQGRVEQALQGKAAGVNIMQESGSPGAGMTVRIRGTGTNKNANPLFLVDGMRTDGIEYLNPNDVASIEILKDAASCAIYGADAGNGVVLVTTKSGKGKGQSVINYNFNFGMQSPARLPKVLNAEQYATYYRDGLRYESLMGLQQKGIDVAGMTDAQREQLLKLIDRNVNASYPFSPDTLGEGTDWLGEIFGPAPMVEHNLSYSGGDKNTSVFASGSYFSQDGIVGGSKANFKRYTARLNVDHKLKDWLSVGANVSFTHFERKSIEENNEFGGVISNAQNLDPLTPVYYNDTSLFPQAYKGQIYDNIDNIDASSLKAPNGKGYYGMSEYVQNEVKNPRAQIDNRHEEWFTDKVLGGFNARLSPIKGLTLKTAYDIDLSYGNKYYWNPEYYYHSISFSYLNSTGQESYRWFTWQWENTATYTKNIGNHNFMGLMGTTARNYTHHSLTGFGEGLQEESWNFAVLDAVLSDSTKSAAHGNRNQDDRLLSYFGRVQYNYKERYMLDLVYRVDGSSKLNPNNRFQSFPSVSAGWIMSREGFMSDLPMYLKLKAGWGQNGSLRSLGNFAYVSTISSGAESSYYLSGGTKLTGAEPLVLSNQGLVWETSEQTNIGMDLRLLNDRVSLSADYYIKKTIDLITEASVPEYVGNKKPQANQGTVVNKGLELELSYKDNVGDLNYQISATAAYNKNEMTNLPQELQGSNLGTTGAVTRSMDGYPIWYFYGYRTDGIFNSFDEINAYVDTDGALIQPKAMPGDVRFRDINNDGVLNEDDKTMIGSPHPDWLMGFSFSVDYKGIDLSMFLNASLGNDVYFGASRTDITGNNKPLFYYQDAWTPENMSDKWPRYTVTDNNNNFAHSDMFVFDGSYLRLTNLELGYTLPADLSRRMGISKLRVYTSAQNLLVITKYPGADPEVGNTSSNDSDMKSIGVDRGLYPKARVISAGFNLTF